MSEENKGQVLIQEMHEELEKLLQSDDFSEEQKSLILRKIMDDHNKEVSR